MRRTEFEDILISETPYYKKAQKLYRDTTNFNRHIAVLQKISKAKDLLNKFQERGGKELVYLGRKIFSLQEEFVLNYLSFLKNETAVDKWEESFERYSNNLFEICQRFTGSDSVKLFIFEIVNRKLLKDFLTKYTTNMPTEQKILVCERIGIVVNQLFNYIRNSLAKNIVIYDNLIIDSYEKIPLLPQCSRSETMRLLSKQFLQHGLPEPVFSAIVKSLATTYYTDEKEKILKELAKLKSALTKDKICEILNSHPFFPDERTLEEVLSVIKAKMREIVEGFREKKDFITQKIANIEKKLRDATTTIAADLINRAGNFSTEEAVDNDIKRLRRTILTHGYELKNLQEEYQEASHEENELNNLLRLKSSDWLKFISKSEWDPFLILILNRLVPDEEQLQLIMKETVNELKTNKQAMAVINRLRTAGFFKEKYNTTEINKRFQSAVSGIIYPLIKSFLLEELIDYYPKLAPVGAPESIRYLAEEALAGNVSLIEKDLGSIQKSTPQPALNILRYKNLVSVLVYDIRGSTFMGTKLQNAKKENEIRKLFQESMLTIVEKYRGIPIKDTGDGGIVLFAANNYEIKNNMTVELKPGNTLGAVRCGLEMVQEAENFVRENISRYQDWFASAEEREINFEGATYATLPPAYQSIFQIGIGIASGSYPNEIYLDKNAFGDHDLTGMLVREANFYSKVKAREKSTIICDDSTVYNLLLNVDKFSFLAESGLRIDSLLMDIDQGLEYWINQKITRHGFILDLYKIFVTRWEDEICHPRSLKILLGADDIVVDETGEIKDSKGGRGKFLFEITQEVRK